MTEKEKMLNGQMYMPNDKELSSGRLEAQRTCYRYNQIDPKNFKERKGIIKGLFGQTGSMFCIEQPFRCDYGKNIHIGEYFFSNYNLTILDCAPVYIGSNVMFGPNVSLYTAGHPIDANQRSTGVEHALPIHIGDNVWLGGNVTINPGVTIGNNSVIGSGSVVTRDIPSDVVAAGNPCRVLRNITEDDVVNYTKQFGL